MYICTTRPTEPEHRNGQHHRADHRDRKAVLRYEIYGRCQPSCRNLRRNDARTSVDKLWLEYFECVGYEGDVNDDYAGNKPDECKPILTEVEAVSLDEDNAEGFNEDVQNTIHERDVEVPKEHDGLDEAEHERPDERVLHHIRSSEALNFYLALRLELTGRKDAAQTTSTAI